MSVVELKTRPLEIAETVVERLEVALDKAKAGKISAIAIAIVTEDGAANCSWSETDSVGILLGSIVRMQHRLCLSIDENNK